MTRQRNATSDELALLNHARRLANNHRQRGGGIPRLRHDSRNGLWWRNSRWMKCHWLWWEFGDKYIICFLTIQPLGETAVGSDSQTTRRRWRKSKCRAGKSGRKSIHDGKSDQSRRIRICAGTWFPVMSSLNGRRLAEKSEHRLVLRVQTEVGD